MRKADLTDGSHLIGERLRNTLGNIGNKGAILITKNTVFLLLTGK